MPEISIDFKCADWASVLDPKYRYIFISGGRSSGKSHEIANYITEEQLCNPDNKIVCLREVQKSIKFSSKLLIENKIRESGSSQFFNVIQPEIRSELGDGVMIFQGMSDLTADNMKSLEGFIRAWFEEAQNCSARSLKLLRPTIRSAGSQIIFSWNPEFPDDPIEKFSESMRGNPDALHIHVNYDKNPYLTEETKKEIEFDRVNNPDDFDHVWLGAYNIKSELRVFNNWIVEECEPTYDDDLYYGVDWGFAQDPNVLLRCWINQSQKKIYVDYQIDGVGIPIDQTPSFFDDVPDSRKYTIRADSARPEMVDYMNRRGFSCKSVEKGAGSIEQGINFLKSYQIVVHPRCELLQKELRLHSYKTNRAGDILPKMEDKHNDCIDSLRYSIEPLIKENKQEFIIL